MKLCPIRTTAGMSDRSLDEEHAGLSSRPGFDPTFMKEGYLQKQGQLLKGWKKRWFVCDGRSLSYFHTKADKTPSAVIPLETATVQGGGTSERWNGPKINVTDTVSGVVYCLSGEDGATVMQWLDVLQHAVQHISNTKAATDCTTPLRHKSHSFPSGMKANTDFSIRGSPRKPPASISESIVLAPNSAASSSKRSKSRAAAAAKQPPVLSTSLRLENDLTAAMELLSTLLFQHSRFHITPSLDDDQDPSNVRIGVVTDPATGKQYVRGTIVLDVVPALALRVLLDPRKRPEWDVHFPDASLVASFGGATDLLHLASTSSLPIVGSSHHATLLVVVISATAAAVVAAIWTQSLAQVASAVVIGAMLGAVLVVTVAPETVWKHLVEPRDLLLLRHVYEAQSSMHLATSNSNDSMVVAELSTVNELKPISSNVTRATLTVGGWLIQSAGTDATLLTHVVSLSLNGWLTPPMNERVVRARVLRCLPALAAYLKHAQTFGPHLGYHDDPYDIDAFGDEEADAEPPVDDDMHDLLATDLPFRSSASTTAAADVFHPRHYMRAVVRNPTGGVTLTDKDVAKKQNGVVMEVLKKMGAKILDGKSAVSLSLPVRIFEPRSMLERLVDFYMYAPNYLGAASDAADDPVTRFKLTMAFAVAGWHHAMGCAKPFNSIVGETLQAALQDGATVHCEQAASSPLPIAYAQIVHPKYALSSYAVVNVAMHTNTFTQVQNGPVRVSFPDGGLIELNLPSLRVSGLLWGDRVLDLVGTIHFQDKANGLACDLKLNFDEHKSMFSSSKLPTDHFRGTILHDGETVCDVTGSWLDELRVGDEVVWNFERDSCPPLVRLQDDQVLPSDSRNRPDLRALASYDLEEAQERKFEVENLQRSDRALRKEGRRPNHWTFAL
ncbi:hypothetical protein H310_06667 [Aphanomyces invadans]|uniref:PH domain-containing protein n=1 Tax=Aphanomyces invadans TaxID=157072 RepID=A0A024U3P8_9STRA|nr:hypothetical protein H310_06667 [Aphanomyces invadans]ETW01036.1 hypothetical protein H310_06667 [Aphanomyces invadans]|eukprot:XP_008870034.1 hypothetical protein H310_06667 [Aphanomyces invadans]